MQRDIGVPCLKGQLGEKGRCHFRIRFYSIGKSNLAYTTELPRPGESSSSGNLRKRMRLRRGSGRSALNPLSLSFMGLLDEAENVSS
jgi:hypothetical protein